MIIMRTPPQQRNNKKCIGSHSKRYYTQQLPAESREQNGSVEAEHGQKDRLVGSLRFFVQLGA